MAKAMSVKTSSLISKKQGLEFASCIAEAIRGQLLEEIRSSPCFSIMLDESYDLGWKCQLLMSVRFLDHGRPRTVFLRLIELKRRYVDVNGQRKFVTSGEALSIAYAVRDQMECDGLDFSKMVCLCTDGANAMMGGKSGAGVLIKAWCGSYLLHYHCVAHKLALSGKHAPLENAAAFLEDTVRQILGYYKQSGERKAVLAELQDQLGVSQLKLLKLHRIRWLSLASVVDRILELYPALRLQFDNDNDAAALHIRTVIEGHKFLGLLAGCRDILCQQAVANRMFQKTDVHWKMVTEAKEATVLELRQTYIEPHEQGKKLGGRSYKKVLDSMEITTPLRTAKEEAKNKVDKTTKIANSVKSEDREAVRNAKDVGMDGASSGMTGTSHQSGDGKRMARSRSNFGKTQAAEQEWQDEQVKAEEKKASQALKSNKVVVDGEVRYIVESILDERMSNGKRELHIKWQGYDHKYNTWEPAGHIPDELVDEFRATKLSQSRESMSDRHSRQDYVYQYESVDVIVNEEDKQYVAEGITKFAANVIEGLERQFPGDTSTILDSFDIFHLDSLPHDSDKWELERDSYGEDEIVLLTTHFSDFLSPDGPTPKVETVHQWRNLRNEMWKHRIDLVSNPEKRLDKDGSSKRSWVDVTIEFWSTILNKPGPHYADLVLKLVAIFLVLVLSSVPCERYFRKMNLQKDLLRTRMRTEVLDNRMMIAENGPECHETEKLKFIIALARRIWLCRKKRIPNNSRQQPRPERRKSIKKDGMKGLLLDRGYDSDDLTSDEDEDRQCKCTFQSCQVQKDIQIEDSDRSVLVPEEGWQGVQISAMNVQKTIDNALLSADFRIAIQYPTGWNTTGQILRVEPGLCEHLRSYRGWVWVRMTQEGESTATEHLRSLDVEGYGMDSRCSWYMMRRDE